MRCPGASTLPQIEETERDPALAEAGVAEHAHVLRPGGLPSNLSDWLCIASPAYEQPFIADFTSGKVTTSTEVSNQSRAYRIENPHATAGTPDAYAVWIDSESKLHVRVGDLKTGAGQAAGSLPHPSESWQLRYYALVILMWMGWPAATAFGSCRVAFWTRDHEAERESEPDVSLDARQHCWRITESELSEDTLRESLDTLCELSERLARGASDVWREGEWCERCPVFRACPVQQSPIRRLGISLEGGSAQSIGDATARNLVEALGPARRLVEQAEQVLARYMARTNKPLTLSNGQVLYRAREARRQVTQTALPVLRELCPAEYPQMVRESTSVSRIAAALGEAVPGERTAALLARVQETPGAIAETSTFRLRVRKTQTD